MHNPNLTVKERNLLKGAIRRVFSRSELRMKIINRSYVKHHDPTRPRVTKWSRCEVCQELSPKYKMAVDHKDPVIPVSTSLELMTWDELVNRIWCAEDNLQAICEPCHDKKSKQESAERKAHRKGRKK